MGICIKRSSNIKLNSSNTNFTLVNSKSKLTKQTKEGKAKYRNLPIINKLIYELNSILDHTTEEKTFYKKIFFNNITNKTKLSSTNLLTERKRLLYRLSYLILLKASSIDISNLIKSNFEFNFCKEKSTKSLKSKSDKEYILSLEIEQLYDISSMINQIKSISVSNIEFEILNSIEKNIFIGKIRSEDMSIQVNYFDFTKCYLIKVYNNDNYDFLGRILLSINKIFFRNILKPFLIITTENNIYMIYNLFEELSFFSKEIKSLYVIIKEILFLIYYLHFYMGLSGLYITKSNIFIKKIYNFENFLIHDFTHLKEIKTIEEKIDDYRRLGFFLISILFDDDTSIINELNKEERKNEDIIKILNSKLEKVNKNKNLNNSINKQCFFYEKDVYIFLIDLINGIYSFKNMNKYSIFNFTYSNNSSKLNSNDEFINDFHYIFLWKIKKSLLDIK